MVNAKIYRLTKDIKETIDLAENEEMVIVTFNNGKESMKTTLTINQYANSILKLYNVVTTSNPSVLDEEVNMIGINANCEIINVLLVKDTTLNSRIVINHLVEHTTSLFNNYAIATGNTHVVLDNNATIKKGCKGSIVNQKAKGLSLNPNAVIEAKPNLFIDEYDVIANHAASIGGLNKEDLFYLTSRGLTVKEASTLIVGGFIKPVIDRIDDKELNEEIYNSFISML